MSGYKKGKAIKLTKNFKTTEFDCKGKGCCSTTLIDNKLVTKLQLIRDYFNKPVVINSGYRCTKYNKAVGGVKSSQHLLGRAADIKIQGVAPKEVAAYAEKIGLDGIGIYNTFTHIDTRGYKARWRG